MELDT